MQIATLGYVIAHELSHSLSPQLILRRGTNITLDASVTAYQSCVGHNLQASGSHNAERTLQEAFADQVAINTIARVFREANDNKALQLGYTLYAQNFCNTDAPKSRPPSTGLRDDSHPTPYLRVDTTIKSQLQMQTAFGCPAQFNHGYTCQ